MVDKDDDTAAIPSQHFVRDYWNVRTQYTLTYLN